jgi:hypothetical protein
VQLPQSNRRLTVRTVGDFIKEGAMRRSIRLTVFACAAALALAVVALAAASYTPSMGIFQSTYRPGGAGAVTVVVAQEQADDPTAKITIYVAPGYTTTLGQAAGATIGSVTAHVQVLDLGPNALPLTGPVKADNPASYVSNPCAPGTHEAVWTLNAALPGQPANPIPVYVDHTTGAEAVFSSAKLQVCFRDPNLPRGDPRRSPNGTKFLDAAFTVRGVFGNPSSSGRKLWQSVFTPYTPGTGTPNAAASAEAQAVVPMPYSLTVKRVKARRGFFRLAGRLNFAGTSPSNHRISLYAGVTKGGRVVFGSRAVTSTKTKKRGIFVFNRRLPKKTTYFFAERPPSSSSCATPTIIANCTVAITSNTISRVIKIVPPKKRR